MGQSYVLKNKSAASEEPRTKGLTRRAFYPIPVGGLTGGNAKDGNRSK